MYASGPVVTSVTLEPPIIAHGFRTVAFPFDLSFAREQGVRVIVSETFLDNAASQRVLETLGFEPKGICKKTVSTRDGPQTLQKFALSL